MYWLHWAGLANCSWLSLGLGCFVFGLVRFGSVWLGLHKFVPDWFGSVWILLP